MEKKTIRIELKLETNQNASVCGNASAIGCMNKDIVFG